MGYMIDNNSCVPESNMKHEIMDGNMNGIKAASNHVYSKTTYLIIASEKDLKWLQNHVCVYLDENK